MANTTEFPAMTSIEELPLHPKSHSDLYLDGSEFYACDNPERPREIGTLYDWRCRACCLHAEATVQQGDDALMWWNHRDGPGPTRLSYLVRRAHALGVLDGD